MGDGPEEKIHVFMIRNEMTDDLWENKRFSGEE